MKLKQPINVNYCATVVKIQSSFVLDKCDNIKGTNIFDNQVLISNKVKNGEIGLFFPVETKLSNDFLRANNLYRDKVLNADPTKAGYFEKNGRIKCMKFRSNDSEGFYIEIDSLISLGVNPADLKVGDEFDVIKDIPVCEKYVRQLSRTPGSGGGSKSNQYVKISKLVDNQFRLHSDTTNFYKNYHKMKEDDIVSISYKVHGTSGVSSNILCNRKLSILDKVFKALGGTINSQRYENIFSSRKVIKNDDANPKQPYANAVPSKDIWERANDVIKPYLSKGMSAYYEIIGYGDNGKAIQKGYTYGLTASDIGKTAKYGVNFDIHVYKLTYTNVSGKVINFSAKQVQQWAEANSLHAVEELFYGTVKELIRSLKMVGKIDLALPNWQELLFKAMKEKYTDKNCHLCNDIVPEEGAVIVLEGLNPRVYKLKSPRFLERETKMITKGVVDIEA